MASQLEKNCLHLARDAEMAKYLILAGAELEARDKVLAINIDITYHNKNILTYRIIGWKNPIS